MVVNQDDGDPGAIRTLDLLIKSQLLYQLSYGIAIFYKANRLRILRIIGLYMK